MKNTYSSFICVISALIFTVTISKAQTVSLKPAPAHVTIDGNAAEWGDLPYTNDKAKVSYTISNDKDNLYLVVKTKDPVMQSDVLGSGITFSINTKGRKTTTYWTTFPARGKEDPSEYQNLDTIQTQAKIALTKYRKMTVKGFADISDAQLSSANVYGIQVAVGYDDAGYLVYEEAIPLVLFHSDNADKEWAFNISINGLMRSAIATSTIVMGSSRDDHPSTGSATVTVPAGQGFTTVSVPQGTRAIATVVDQNAPGIQLTPSVDFWVKFNLAK